MSHLYVLSFTCYPKDFTARKACKISAVFNSNLKILMNWEWDASPSEKPQELNYVGLLIISVYLIKEQFTLKVCLVVGCEFKDLHFKKYILC